MTIIYKCTINDNHMIYDGSWDINCNCNRQIFFVILGLFFAFLPPNSPKNQNFKKWEKHLEISSFYTSVPKNMIIGYTVPEICHVTDIIIFHFGLFLALFYPANNPKKWKSQKMKKLPKDIIILHKCTKRHDHMLYCSWDMARDECNCYFGHFFALLPP